VAYRSEFSQKGTDRLGYVMTNSMCARATDTFGINNKTSSQIDAHQAAEIHPYNYENINERSSSTLSRPSTCRSLELERETAKE
jgi:hypothetical protein